ncbi:protein BIG GRAIN 1-like E [Humulus lupulus]|uniref:protein BIG GRAIN 1-like E n=1 Tax=Humulus lupulus TaxID=3486 RepID=UPI002B40BE4F|nr:protein BIG GRAIN 1-like E [Humulus lupulus]
MSLAGSLNPADPEKLFKKSFHRRNDSGELDVFEAARYFSGYNESCGATSFNQKICSKDQDHHSRAYWSNSSSSGTRGSSGGRISLDMPRRSVLNLHNHHDHHDHHHHHGVLEKQIKEKKYKQPSSPGGRLASFLNSLFNQSSSKKKIKSKSTTGTSALSMKDYDQDDQSGGGGRRKRRSSISHFGSSSTNTTTTDSKASSFYSYNSSSSGFRTPPPHAQLTPTKNFRSFSENHKQLVSTLCKFSNNNANNGINNKAQQNDNDQAVKDLLSLSSSTHLEHDQKENVVKNNIKGSNALSSSINQKDKVSNRPAHEHHRQKQHDLKKFHQSEKKIVVLGKFDEDDDIDEEDDGADSDSSSDLFELQNYDLGCYSSGLPVYETTNMDSIKRGSISSAPISNI